MNWKIVATLMVGSLLVAACGAQQSAAPSPAAPVDDPTVQEEKPGDPAKPKPNALQNPAPKDPAKDPATDARKDIVVHQ